MMEPIISTSRKNKEKEKKLNRMEMKPIQNKLKPNNSLPSKAYKLF